MKTEDKEKRNLVYVGEHIVQLQAETFCDIVIKFLRKGQKIEENLIHSSLTVIEKTLMISR